MPSRAGLGFVFTEKNVSYVDIDDCVDPETMQLDKEAHAIMRRVSSYTELSTSGTGIHILCQGNSPSYGWSPDDYELNIEIFDGSWLAITQRHIEGTPLEVGGNDQHLSSLCDEYDIDTHGGW